MNTAIIGLGSNINPKENIRAAYDVMSADEKVTVCKRSSLAVTKPVGYADQPDFTNGAAFIETDLDIEPLQAYLKVIENRLGRIRTDNKFGPRTIDLDIIVWNSVIVDSDYFERDFLQSAVAELVSPETLSKQAAGKCPKRRNRP